MTKSISSSLRLTSDPNNAILGSDPYLKGSCLASRSTIPPKKDASMINNKWLLLVLSAFALSSRMVPAQTSEQPDALFDTVKALDAKLFGAYNHCDLAVLGSMVSDDLEFYHDQTGLMVGKQPFLAAIRQNICGKVQRTLIESTLEVYPLRGYGAVEIGIHRFHHPNEPDNIGDARFVMIWHDDNGTWKVTRTISYQHNQGFLAK